MIKKPHELSEKLIFCFEALAISDSGYALTGGRAEMENPADHRAKNEQIRAAHPGL